MFVLLAKLVGIEGTRACSGSRANQRTLLAADNRARARAGETSARDRQFVTVLLPKGAMTSMTSRLGRPQRSRRKREYHEYQ